MPHPFSPKDVVVCCDAEPRQPWSGLDWPLKKESIYRIEAILSDRSGNYGVTLRDVDHRPGHGWHAWRFRKIERCDDAFKLALAKDKSLICAELGFAHEVRQHFTKGLELQSWAHTSYVTGMHGAFLQRKYRDHFGEAPPRWMSKVHSSRIWRLCQLAIDRNRMLPDSLPHILSEDDWAGDSICWAK